MRKHIAMLTPLIPESMLRHLMLLMEMLITKTTVNKLSSYFKLSQV